MKVSGIRGTLDVLVLKALSWTPLHAFEIIAWLGEQSDGRLDVDGPALIQALHRMEEKKLVAGEWGTRKNSRRARADADAELDAFIDAQTEHLVSRGVPFSAAREDALRSLCPRDARPGRRDRAGGLDSRAPSRTRRPTEDIEDGLSPRFP
jgi:hypothetical protein